MRPRNLSSVQRHMFESRAQSLESQRCRLVRICRDKCASYSAGFKAQTDNLYHILKFHQGQVLWKPCLCAYQALVACLAAAYRFRNAGSWTHVSQRFFSHDSQCDLASEPMWGSTSFADHALAFASQAFASPTIQSRFCLAIASCYSGQPHPTQATKNQATVGGTVKEWGTHNRCLRNWFWASPQGGKLALFCAAVPPVGISNATVCVSEARNTAKLQRD